MPETAVAIGGWLGSSGTAAAAGGTAAAAGAGTAAAVGTAAAGSTFLGTVGTALATSVAGALVSSALAPKKSGQAISPLTQADAPPKPQNAQAPEVLAQKNALAASATGALSGNSSTVLTGAQGISPANLSLGRSTLLGQ